MLGLLFPILAACGSSKIEETAGAPPEPPADVATTAVADVAPSAPTPAVAPSPKPDGELTLSAVGDCTLADPYGSDKAPGSFHRMFDDTGGDLARPFSGVHDILASDDLTIANFEGTLGTHAGRTDVAFAFRGRPAFASMLPAGSVELVNLANNHSGDCGPLGVVDTQKALEDAGVGWFGLGKVDVRTVRGIEVVNLGYTGGREEVKGQVQADVRRYKKPGNLVLVSFHWGIEGSHAINSVQINLGHAAIDAGADLVIGTHPHVLQGIEEYKGKKILYSLGNFVFGGNARPGEWESMIYRTRFALEDGVITRVAEDELIPVQVSGSRTQNDFRPVVLEGELKEKVLANVAKYSASIGRGSKHKTATAERSH
ncbi:MAG: CapA family protein [Polyangiaceae bacterium]